MKTEKKKLNVRLLRKIQRHILEEPKRFLMRAFVETGKPGTAYMNDEWEFEKFPACGTAACIGGWACILNGKLSARNGDFEIPAARLLGVTRSRNFMVKSQADRLFHVPYWPEQFKHEFRRAHGATAHARIAAARIDHFIATKGAE